MLIVKEKGSTVQPMGSLRDGAAFMWATQLFIKIPSLSSNCADPMNNVLRVATACITDMQPATMVQPVVINEVHIREI